jgi:predicted RNA methylase
MITESTAQLIADALEQIDGLTIPPMPEVDRPTYDQFAEVVKRLRGKWKRGKGHVFEYDPEPALRAVLETRELPDKNPLAYFPTPMKLAHDLVSLISPGSPGLRILEPSAGSGNLIAAAKTKWPAATVVGVEADPINVAQLGAREWPTPSWWDRWCDDEIGYGDVEIMNRNFLALDERRLGGKFNIIIMNPPFSVDGDRVAWETHMRHAWSLLEDGGALMCLAPAGTWETSTRKRFVQLRSWLDQIGASKIMIEDGAFAESGTKIKTLALYAYKVADGEWSEKCNGYPSFYAWGGWLTIDNSTELADRNRKLKKKRADPNGPEFRKLYADAARQWNSGSAWGLPITDRYFEQMAAR